MGRIGRRQFLLVAGSAAGFAAAGGACSSFIGKADRPWPIVTRKISALGTEVSITARHPSPTAAERAIAAAFGELALVERLLSIYRPESQLSLLNRHGHLAQPHRYLVEVLQHAQHVSQQSSGAFDVTVQPLWETFASAAKEHRLPDNSAIAAAQANVDWRQLSVSADSVQLLKPGMRITLNGIAQGFATDRVLAALQAGGVEHALINAGELQPLGRSERGDAWRVGIQHPREKSAYIALADLDGRALATSGDYATQFSADRRHNHILDPRTGYSPTELCSVSILAPTGLAADALSTACFVLGLDRSLTLINSIPGIDGFFVLKDGETIATGGFPLRTEGSLA